MEAGQRTEPREDRADIRPSGSGWASRRW